MAEGDGYGDVVLPLIRKTKVKGAVNNIGRTKQNASSKKERYRKAYLSSLKKRGTVFRLNTSPQERDSRLHLPPIQFKNISMVSVTIKQNRKTKRNHKEELGSSIVTTNNSMPVSDASDKNRKGVHFTPAYTVTQTYSVPNLRNRTKENFAKRIAENSGKITIKDLFQKYEKSTEKKHSEDRRNKTKCIFPDIRSVTSPSSVDLSSDDESLSRYTLFQHHSQPVPRLVL